ncbi:glycoside hydrolase family 3 N-terminal domain-containing protein [Alkalibacterium iburiense]|uniref:beta-glucosidase n=1 Tax=Alkalibacterium iburiense TaxID=290589 RepID=A0ABN0XIK0_9LACT
MNTEELHHLIKEMTLEEKIGQMTQLAGYLYEESSSDVTGPLSGVNAPEFLDSTNGSIVGSYGAATIREIQSNYLEKSRLKIPLLFTADVIHGYRTIFPLPFAIGNSWNVDLAEKSAEVAAKESAVSGIHLTFSPMVDLTRDPRWGRVVESTGEDPYLNAEFSRAFVKGYQGDELGTDPMRIAACVKHFVAYGLSQGGREYNTVDVSERELLENHVSGFEAAIEAGVEMVMTSFNPVNGIPSTGNKKLIKGLLREKLGFDGVVISDWNSLGELITHGVAEDEIEAAQKALDATVDIEMMTFCYAAGFQQLLDENKISMDSIDASVMRILKLKNKLGLFEDPYRGLSEEKEKEVVFSDEHRQIAREVAEESIVLLKNEQNVLPLSTDKKVALIGPFGTDSNVLGTWYWRGEESEAVQLLDSLEERLDKDSLVYAKGSDITEGNKDWLEEAKAVAESADIVILALGEHAKMSGEAASRSNIQLPEAQLELVKKVKEAGKPMVAVLFNGRPLDLTGVVDEVDAIVETWFLGTESGHAISNVLYGDVNPSGKLTMSFPYNVGQIPVHYNHFKTGRPVEDGSEFKWLSRYLDVPNEPRYSFGYGLSYTTFEYGDMKLSSDTFSKEEGLTVEVTVRNTGQVAGKEIVQFYVQDLVGEVIRPVKELKGFEKIDLAPGESKDVRFTLTEDMVRYVHSNLEKKSDPGRFKVFIGSSSDEVQEKEVRLVN